MLPSDHASPLVCNFERLPPRHETPQERSFGWLAQAHAMAMTADRGGSAGDVGEARERMREMIDRYGCKPDRIARRSHEVSDWAHTRWDDMDIYPLRRAPFGVGARERMLYFERSAGGLFERAYGPGVEPPGDLVHVTCTGYVSPSPAQQLVARRGWGEITRVTHAYHMGCYAAFPALRLAHGLLAAGGAPGRADERVDIVHTELCSLHLDLTMHTPEQIIIQTLFADGAIRYSVRRDHEGRGGGLRVLAAREAIVADSAEAMRWVCSDFGMQMRLARDVAARIAPALVRFLYELFAAAHLDFAREKRGAVFAVHPGGPKIVDQVRDALELDEAQVAASRRVLLDHGNMSSATLPHVWMRLTRGPDSAPDGALVVSLGFGPGLTVCGAVFRRAGGD